MDISNGEGESSLKALFRNGYTGYDSYSDEELLAEYEELVETGAMEGVVGDNED